MDAEVLKTLLSTLNPEAAKLFDSAADPMSLAAMLAANQQQPPPRQPNPSDQPENAQKKPAAVGLCAISDIAGKEIVYRLNRYFGELIGLS